jgi:heptosyltransferase-2
MVENITRSESEYSALRDAGSPNRVLIIRIGRLGDTILATPIIEPLRQTFGMDVLIDFAVGPGASEAILNLDRRINRVFPIAHRRVPWRIHPMKHALRRHSREAPYDLVVNLECGAQCDDFIRFVQTREFHGRPLIRPRHIPGRHCVDTEKSIYASVLGVEATAAAEPSLKLQPNEEVQSTGVEGDYVILNPGFSGLRKQDYRSHRSWPNRSWVKLIGLITQRSGLSVAINGTEEERQCFKALLEMPGVHSLFGSSLPTLIRALERARCIISVDTGTMHLATALGIPVIALFGPSNFELSGPYSTKVPWRVLTSGIDCQPCYQTPLQKQCKSNRCMQTLRPEVVYQAFEGIKPNWTERCPPPQSI